MLSLVEKLEDLKARLDNDTYIDVILQSLPPSYDLFIINYNMNVLKKMIHVATTHKSALAVLVGTSTSKMKGKRTECCKRKKGKATTATTSVEAPLLPQRKRAKGRLEVLSGRRQMMCSCIAMERGIGRGSVHNSSPAQVLERSRRLSKDEMILRLGDGKAVAAEAVGCLSLVISDHIRIELKDCYYVPKPSKTVPQTPYEIWHGKPASYKYLRVWGSPAYIKRLVGDKLDSRSSLCRFIGYPKETVGYYFYNSSDQKIFISRNAVFLKKGFPADSRRDEVLLEESSEPPLHDNATSFEPSIPTDGVLVLRRSTRESRPERYGF
ncbi:UNVERIFIED_CONTAM: hypothetical protein Slati_2708900 [Sesamum latifolium]|uniref:Retroviral polymerase SH3-like domain-containing protein n=1 Tax=Sesamum latifolium TaxID=2727402 RepID=A0AAW2VXV0_9LAMI